MAHDSRRFGLTAGLIAALTTNCIAYSSYQDARIVKDNHSQGSVAFSTSSLAENGEAKWYPLEMNPRWGLGGSIDASFKMSLLFTPETGGALPILGGDVRAGVIPNYLALTLPVSFILGNGFFHTTNLQPGVIVTLPLASGIDVNGSARASFYPAGGLDAGTSMIYNVGLGLEMGPGWTLRPEYGWMTWSGFGDDDRVAYQQFGCAITKSSGPAQ